MGKMSERARAIKAKNAKNRLEECWIESGITQKELAERVHYSPVYINQLIKGKNLSIEAARKIAAVLGVRFEYLLYEDNAKTIEEQKAHISEDGNLLYSFLDFMYNTRLEIDEIYKEREEVAIPGTKIIPLAKKCDVILPEGTTFICDTSEIVESLKYIREFALLEFKRLAKKSVHSSLDE